MKAPRQWRQDRQERRMATKLGSRHILAPFQGADPMSNDFQGLRSLHSLNPWLFSCHAFGVRRPKDFKLTHYRNLTTWSFSQLH
jgi:hypothetical protein